MKANLAFLCIVTGLLCITSCDNESLYKERDVKLLAWLEEEQTTLTGTYQMGDSVAFFSELNGVAWFVIDEIKSDVSRLCEKGWIQPPKETYIDKAMCSCQLGSDSVKIVISAIGQFDYLLDDEGQIISDRYGNYLYKEEPTINRQIKIYRWPIPDIKTALQTPPPSYVKDNEVLYLTSSEKDGITLQEWALVRRGQGIIKIADAYGHTWNITDK